MGPTRGTEDDPGLNARREGVGGGGGEGGKGDNAPLRGSGLEEDIPNSS